MKESYRVTGAEREIIEVLWENSGTLATRELLERMTERGRNWKRQTLNTLLTRLEAKGVVSRRRAYVQAVLTKEELLQKQTQEILNEFYDGKLENFLTALTGATEMKQEQTDRLHALLKEMQKR